jgi:hypothetical protein
MKIDMSLLFFILLPCSILDHFSLLRTCCYREAAAIMSQINSELNVQLKKNAKEALCLPVGEREFFTSIV